MGRVSAILPTTLYPRRKNNWKELGLNPGPLNLQATTLTTTIDLGSFLRFKANIGRTHKCSRLQILERKFLQRFPSCWCIRTWSKKKNQLFLGLGYLNPIFSGCQEEQERSLEFLREKGHSLSSHRTLEKSNQV